MSRGRTVKVLRALSPPRHLQDAAIPSRLPASSLHPRREPRNVSAAMPSRTRSRCFLSLCCTAHLFLSSSPRRQVVREHTGCCGGPGRAWEAGATHQDRGSQPPCCILQRERCVNANLTICTSGFPGQRWEIHDCDGVWETLEVGSTMMRQEQHTGRMAGRSYGQSSDYFPDLVKWQVSFW